MGLDTYRVQGDDGTGSCRSARPPAEDDLRRQIAMLPELARGGERARSPSPSTRTPRSGMAYRPIPRPALFDATPTGSWPERLGRFLYDLHVVPPEFVGLRRAIGGRRADAGARRVRSSARASSRPCSPRNERASSSGPGRAFLDDDALWRFAPCLVHADLGLEHILVTTDGRPRRRHRLGGGRDRRSRLGLRIAAARSSRCRGARARGLRRRSRRRLPRPRAFALRVDARATRCVTA